MTANKGVVLPCRGIRKPLGHPEHDCEQGGCLPCRGIRKPLVHPKPGCEQGGCFVMPGYQESAGPLVAALRTRGLFCLVRVSESRWATRSRTANKGVVSPCRVVMKPLGYPEQNCEQGGCFVLSGCHEAARPPGADLRTRGLFYSVGISEIRGLPEPDCEQGGCFVMPVCQEYAVPPGAGLRTRLFCSAGVSESRWATRSRLRTGVVCPAGYQARTEAAMRTRGLFCPAGQSESCWSTRSRTANKGVVLSCRVSESRWATRSRTANKGVVLPCGVVMKPQGHPEQNCEQGGCFVLPGYQKAAGPPEAALRTRGLFCPAGVSESRWATRSRTANKVVLSHRAITDCRAT
nr:hypothetical protein KK467_p1875 [Klebsiella pneumoniae]